MNTRSRRKLLAARDRTFATFTNPETPRDTAVANLARFTEASSLVSRESLRRITRRRQLFGLSTRVHEADRTAWFESVAQSPRSNL